MAADCFLKIDDIKGESLDEKHCEWIEILSYDHGVSQMASDRSTAGAATSGRCDHQDFSIVKSIDISSAPLNLACCEGRHIPEVVLQLCTAARTKEPYMEYLLDNVVITSVSIGGGGGGLPTESVTFNYGKISWRYTAMNHETGSVQGNVEKYWDVVQNMGG